MIAIAVIGLLILFAASTNTAHADCLEDIAAAEKLLSNSTFANNSKEGAVKNLIKNAKKHQKNGNEKSCKGTLKRAIKFIEAT